MEVTEEIKHKYLERRVKDLDVCFESLKKKNFMSLERVGHRLKGSATTFGHPELSSIGEKLERSAGMEDAPQVEAVLKEFNVWLKRKLS